MMLVCAPSVFVDSTAILFSGENTMNGDDLDGPHSTLSQSSKEGGSPTKDMSTEESPKKDKKKKKGLSRPSFLRKKEKKKKIVEA
uniref:Uncharacterized protein n=1 Tax=Timema bartmani TaxID=61472 RepID=A0A7R9EQW2_9NEOP|nr:unnamed protein product [Timema bartmani]